MKFDEKGKPDFLDQKDRAAYRLLLSSMKQKGISKFKMTISIIDSKNLTEKQIKLFNVLVDMISSETGEDIQTIEQTLINNFSKTKKSITDFSNEDFSNFLEWTFSFCNEFFNLNVWINDFGNIETKKNN